MTRKKKRTLHPLENKLLKQVKETGGEMVMPGTPAFELWRSWRRAHGLTTHRMDKATSNNEPYMVPAEFPEVVKR